MVYNLFVRVAHPLVWRSVVMFLEDVPCCSVIGTTEDPMTLDVRLDCQSNEEQERLTVQLDDMVHELIILEAVAWARKGEQGD